jgi:hypothetical protein
VVGYGLDYADEYRNRPYVAALEPGDFGALRESFVMDQRGPAG